MKAAGSSEKLIHVYQNTTSSDPRRE